MPEPKIFAVAGNPVLHSSSPFLFNAAFRDKRLAAVYTRLAAGSGREVLSLFRDLGLAGINVTAPFKEDVLSDLDALDPAAARIGAVNTVVRRGKVLKGYNTDHVGVLQALKGEGREVRGQRALVLGAGGAGRAAVYGLRGAKAEVILFNRTYEKAIRVARRLGCRAEKMENLPSALESAHILVSTLPAGVSPVRAAWLRPGLAVLDAAYPHSPLLDTARMKGCLTIAGEEWLLKQALPAFRIFAGENPDESVMREAFASGWKFPRKKGNISLIGFMGSGKTAVGKLLAGRLGWDFRDMDETIEKKAGLSVPEIFRKRGEGVFRKMEKAALRDMTRRSNVVYSCGGGGPLDPDNRKVLAENSLVIWLHAPLSVCLARTSPGSRPILTRLRSGEEVRVLFRTRLSFYAQAADLIIGSEGGFGLTARKIHEEIRPIL